MLTTHELAFLFVAMLSRIKILPKGNHKTATANLMLWPVADRGSRVNCRGSRVAGKANVVNSSEVFWIKLTATL